MTAKLQEVLTNWAKLSMIWSSREPNQYPFILIRRLVLFLPVNRPMSRKNSRRITTCSKWSKRSKKRRRIGACLAGIFQGQMARFRPRMLLSVLMTWWSRFTSRNLRLRRRTNLTVQRWTATFKCFNFKQLLVAKKWSPLTLSKSYKSRAVPSAIFNGLTARVHSRQSKSRPTCPPKTNRRSRHSMNKWFDLKRPL